MNKRFYTAQAVITCFAGALLLTSCVSSHKEPRLTQQQRQLNVESFECVWTTINTEYWDPQFGGLDWQAVHDELRPKIEQAVSLSKARAILRDMISRLKLSHYAIIPAEVYNNLEQPADDNLPDGATGIDLRVINSHALVTALAENSPAARLGVRTGWEIVRIDDLDVVARLKQLTQELEDDLSKPLHLAYAVIPYLSGRVGDTVGVTFLDGDNRTVELDIPLAEQRGHKSRFGNLGDIRVWIEVKTIDDNIGYIAFDGFFDPPYLMKTFNDGMRSFMAADGVIIDLRGNPGGMGVMAMGMAGWLVPENRHFGTLRMRDNEIKMLVQARPTTYSGPVAILVDGLSGSASEFFAGGLQEMDRACIVGSRTKGEALPGQFKTLPNDDVFIYATSNYVSAGNNTLEGIGVRPDIEVCHTREALLQGRDLVLEAAIDWIRKQE